MKITRTLEGAAKDICYNINGEKTGVVIAGTLYLALPENPPRALTRAVDKLIARAKMRDGIAAVTQKPGRIYIDEDNDIVVDYETITA